MRTGDAERVQILTQHAALRRMVHSLLDTASMVERGADPEGEVLKAQLLRLCFVLEQHLLDEEDLLEPAFARADGTGAPFLARMNVEHARQRAVLGRLHSRLGGRGNPRRLAATASAIGRALLEEMAEEERQLLSPEALDRLRSAAS